MESTLKGSHSSRPQLIAKSPTSDKTLITGGSVSRPGVSGRVRWAIGCLGTVQLVSGLAMSVLGVLCSAYGLAMSRLGAGVSGGLVALLAGLVGLTAAFLPTAVYFTLYLALCLVSLLVNTLVLVLTLLAVVRDAQIDVHLLSPDQGETIWAGQWFGVGLLSATSIHLLSTLLSLPISCRRACTGGDNMAEDANDNKQQMVRTWLGQHNNNNIVFVTTPHIVNESGYLHSKKVMTPTARTKREPHHHHRHTAPSHNQAAEAVERPKRKEKRRKKEITEEELERTYTGLDREIAEEFITIAMKPKPGGQRERRQQERAAGADGSLRSSSCDETTTSTTASSSTALRHNRY